MALNVPKITNIFFTFSVILNINIAVLMTSNYKQSFCFSAFPAVPARAVVPEATLLRGATAVPGAHVHRQRVDIQVDRLID